MTFSDAEDDQPSLLRNHEHRPRPHSVNSVNSHSTSEEASSTMSNTSRAPSSPSEFNANASLSTSTSGLDPQDNVECSAPENISVSRDDDNTEGFRVQQLLTINDSEQPVENDSLRHLEELALDTKDVESQKVLEKLNQIQEYIEQTATAMQTLENEADMSKIGQYNTLAKVMNELKLSESKLVSHMDVIKAKKESGSESIGMVGSFSEGCSNLSLRERLSHHQTEQEVLSSRLQESIIRRQELMTRYQATRERLNNLKRQRLGIVQEERRLLESAGARLNPYEDPVAGVHIWSVEQLEKAIEEFGALRGKIENVHNAYICKLQMLGEGEEEAMEELHRKIEQINCKKTQIESTLTRMTSLLETKRLSEGNRVDNEAAAAVPQDSLEPESSLQSDRGSRQPSESAVEESAMEQIIADHNLQSLKDQLSSIKHILRVTEENPWGEMENAETAEVLHQKRRTSGTNQLNDAIVGVKGDIIPLFDPEGQDPVVISKLRQLAQAKERLAKMEEVMQLIQIAQEEGKPLDEVLSPECMAILNDAREEIESESGSTSVRRESTEIISGTLENSVYHTPFRASRSDVATSHLARKNHVNEINNIHTNWEEDSGAISAPINLHLIKKETPKVPSINEGSKMGGEKPAVKKQTRNLFSGRENDPRVHEVLTLQEELREKKNALEALTRKMGKSSSVALDNISENLSNYDSEMGNRVSASWGATHSQYLSDPYQSDEDILETAEEAIRIAAAASPHRRNLSPPASASLKNRNRCSSNPSRNLDNQQFPVNNFADLLPQSVRPKHSRPCNRIAPVTSWEGIQINKDASSNPDPRTKVQNTFSEALSQLSQVQKTINSLYEALRKEDSSWQQPSVGLQSGQPTFSREGRNNETLTNQLISGLQQCFSQLYLHSLEIQSINKHLQILELHTSPSHQRKNNSSRTQKPSSISHNFTFPNFRVFDDIENDATCQTNHGSEEAAFNSSYANPERSDTMGRINEGLASCDGRYVRRGKRSHLEFNTEDRNCLTDFEEVPMPEYHHSNDDVLLDSTERYLVDSSNQINSHQSSDILNNQVLPGTRANNYWDNFRSYSHQNALSTAPKFNMSTNQLQSTMTIPTTQSEGHIGQTQSISFENREYNYTSNNSINKASDKNSSSTRCINKGVKVKTHIAQNLNCRPVSSLVDRSCCNDSRKSNKPKYELSVENSPWNVGRLLRNSAFSAEEVENMEQLDRVRRSVGEASGVGRAIEASDVFGQQLPRQGNLPEANSVTLEDSVLNKTYNQMVKEAESLMRSHSKQPQFLLQLFRHASRITRDSDQHIALDLLKEISNHAYLPNIEFNRWNSNSSFTQSDNISHCPSLPFKENSFRNKNFPVDERNGISGSDASESGLSSEEDAIDHSNNVLRLKNQSLASKPKNSTFSQSVSSVLQFEGSRSVTKELCKDQSDAIYRKRDDPKRNAASCEATNLEHPRALKGDQGGVKPKRPFQGNYVFSASDKASSKNFEAKPPLVANWLTHRVTVEGLLSACLKEVTKILEMMVHFPKSNAAASILALRFLHQSVMRQVEQHAPSLGLSLEFVASVDAHLEAILQSFCGKRMPQVKQELSVAITQVILQEYYSVSSQRRNYVNPRSSSEEIHPAEGSENLRLPPHNNPSSLKKSFHHIDNCTNYPTHYLWPNIPAEGVSKAESAWGNTQPVDDYRNLSLQTGSHYTVAMKPSTSLSNNLDDSLSIVTNAKAESPASDSSYPESLMPRATTPSAKGETQGDFSQRMNGCEYNDIEADQSNRSGGLTGSRSSITIPGFPVHDLAEADQSQDVNSAFEGAEAAVLSLVASIQPFSPYQNQDSPIRLPAKSHLGSNMSLDEVPTRLFSGPDGASSPINVSKMNGRHPPEGIASVGENRLRCTPPHFSPSQTHHQANGRHPPDGGSQTASSQPTSESPNL